MTQWHNPKREPPSIKLVLIPALVFALVFLAGAYYTESATIEMYGKSFWLESSFRDVLALFVCHFVSALTSATITLILYADN